MPIWPSNCEWKRNPGNGRWGGCPLAVLQGWHQIPGQSFPCGCWGGWEVGPHHRHLLGGQIPHRLPVPPPPGRLKSSLAGPSQEQASGVEEGKEASRAPTLRRSRRRTDAPPQPPQHRRAARQPATGPSAGPEEATAKVADWGNVGSVLGFRCQPLATGRPPNNEFVGHILPDDCQGKKLSGACWANYHGHGHSLDGYQGGK